MPVTILTDEEYNAQGSFHYPPAIRNADQAIAFWENVDIPDEALKKLDSLYDQRRANLLLPIYQARLDKFAAEYVDEWEGRQQAEFDSPSYQEKWNDTGPRGQAAHLKTIEAARSRENSVGRVLAKEQVPYPRWDDPDVDVVDTRPEVIKISELRPIARAGAIYAHTPKDERIGDETREKLLSHQIDLGYDQIMTVQEIEDLYGLSEIRGYLNF